MDFLTKAWLKISNKIKYQKFKDNLNLKKRLNKYDTKIRHEIEKISGHSLRRGAISEARRNDLSINDIKAQSGHKSSQMIDLYSKVSDIKKTSVTKKI